MNYTQTLALAEAHDINICTLIIADEVRCTFGRNHERYEDVCNAVYNLYMKTDRLSVACLTEALSQMLNKYGATLDNVLHYGQDFDEVIELACSLDL